LSILAGTPVGATVVMIDMLAFGVFYVIGSLKNGGH
jgi:zinc transport system permease protein